MSGKPPVDHQKPKNLIRSRYKDVMVKVDEDVYYLDRLKLALKSGYFQKLFTEDYADKNYELIEIPVMDTDTFSAVVDIIYGADFDSVINSDNYISLLMAMDYLQMKIYLGFSSIIVEKQLRSSSSLNMDAFKLYHFITGSANFEFLLSVIFEYLSENLRIVKDIDEFLSIPFDHFLKIISIHYIEPKIEQRTCSKICAKWICHDLDNRLPHSINLVNAIKNRLRLPFDINQENLSKPLPTNEHLNEDTISRYFYELLEYSGEICSSTKADVRGQERRGKTDNPDSESQLDSDSDSRRGSDSASRRGSDSDSRRGSDSDSRRGSDSDSRRGSDSDSRQGSDSDSRRGSDSGSRRGSDSDSRRGSDSDSRRGSDSGSRRGSDSGSRRGSDSDSRRGSDSDSQFESDYEDHLDSNSDSHLEYEYEGRLESDSENENRLESNFSMKKKKRNKYANGSTYEPALITFLEDGNFCDIIVKAGEKKYKLHRSVLKSASGYFEEIFSAEYTEILAKCEGMPVLPSMDKEYFLDEIDQTTFDIIIDHIYSKEVQFSADIIVRLFKAAHVLRIDNLLEECESWMMENSEDVCAQDVIKILNFTHENVKYKNLNRVYVSKYVVDSWPEIGNLPQFADLFKAITVPEEISGCSGENKVYLFNNIDQTTFQLIINYIYHNKLDLKEDNVVRVLKASEIFKMKKLMEKCTKWLTRRRRPADVNSEDLIEVLQFGLRHPIYDDLITIYLVKYVIQWPEIDNSLLCSLSYEFLESMLMSPDFYFDDPYKILDICSKWITHDIENRYHIVPRVALAISRNGLVNCDDYIIESPADLKNCSQEFVKGKLWKILSTTSVLPSAVFSSQEKKLKTEQPIFITSKQGNIFSILNSNMDEITSLHIGKYDKFSGGPMSATMMNDNLFLICSSGKNSIFLVYNFSLKKYFSLALDSRIVRTKKNISKDSRKKVQKYTLLNCCNEIYCCIEDGEVLKYLFELNRWRLFSEAEPDKDGLRFTSDGNNLYRMFRVSQTEHTMNYVMETYNVEQNLWIPLPSVPTLSHTPIAYEESNKDKIEYKLTFMNDFGFSVLFRNKLYLLKQDAERWRIMSSSSLPYICSNFRKRSIITQDESGEMLYMLSNKLHRFSRSNQRWQLKKKLSFLKPISKFEYRKKIFPYGNIIAIHKPIIHTQLLQL